MDGQGAELDMKFQGYIEDTWSPDDSAVAMVKANVTDLPLARGTRSAAAIANDTPVTCPPSDPEAAPALIKSLLVLTAMPVGLPAVGGPSVTPLRVSTCAPAAKLPSTRIDIEPTGVFETVVEGLLLILCTLKPVEDAMMDGQADELDMKFQGYIKETWSQDHSAVAMVKANVTDLPLA